MFYFCNYVPRLANDGSPLLHAEKQTDYYRMFTIVGRNEREIVLKTKASVQPFVPCCSGRRRGYGGFSG